MLINVSNSISSFYDMPLGVIFMDHNSTIIDTNEYTSESVAAISPNDLKNKTARDFYKKEAANILIAHDREVIDSKRLKVSNECVDRFDDYSYESISFKFPWVS